MSFLTPSLSYSFMILLGVTILSASSHWMGMWMGLEICTLSFLPLLMRNINDTSKETAIKYFLIQSMASLLLISGSLLQNHTNLLTSISLFLKLGVAPLHSWFPNMAKMLDWPQLWFLMIPQKMGPLVMLTSQQTPFFLTLLFSLWSSFIGAWEGVKHSHIKKILAFSSIHQMGWILSIMHISSSSSMVYFMAYILLLSITIFLMKINKSQTTFMLNNSPWWVKFNMSLNMLSMGGLPPLTGFFPKLSAASTLIYSNNTFQLIALMLSSVPVLFFYTRIFINLILSAPSPFSNTHFNNTSLILIMNMIPFLSWPILVYL